MYYNHFTGQKQNSHGPQNSGVHSSYKAEKGVMVSEKTFALYVMSILFWWFMGKLLWLL